MLYAVAAIFVWYFVHGLCRGRSVDDLQMVRRGRAGAAAEPRPPPASGRPPRCPSASHASPIPRAARVSSWQNIEDDDPARGRRPGRAGPASGSGSRRPPASTNMLPLGLPRARHRGRRALASEAQERDHQHGRRAEERVARATRALDRRPRGAVPPEVPRHAAAIAPRSAASRRPTRAPRRTTAGCGAEPARCTPRDGLLDRPRGNLARPERPDGPPGARSPAAARRGTGPPRGGRIRSRPRPRARLGADAADDAPRGRAAPWPSPARSPRRPRRREPPSSPPARGRGRRRCPRRSTSAGSPAQPIATLTSPRATAGRTCR